MRMGKGRIEAFSDGVIAIAITIMVLEMKAPHSADLESLRPLLPAFLGYVLSFIYVGIYWNNHHHLFQAVERVTGAVLWANLHLLFWLSVVPFATSWMGENHFTTWPMVVYGVVLLMCGVAFTILARVLVKHHGHGSALAAAMGRDRKGWISLGLYALGIGLAFVAGWIAGVIYLLVALMWLVPDKRIERALERGKAEG